MEKLIYRTLVVVSIINVVFQSISLSNTLDYRKKPFIKNFNKTEYNAANQNWGVAQNNSGELFFANTYGLLEFDGNRWILHQLNDQLIIRSVFADNDGKIYTGSYEEFGYWERDKYGELKYFSLTEFLPGTFDFQNEDIWTILRVDQYVYFHSYARIYRWDGKEIKTIQPDAPIHTMFKINNTLHITLLEKGLYKLKDDLSIIKVATEPYIDNLKIKTILPYNNKELIVSEFNGIFVLKNNRWERWNASANSFLQKRHINKAIKLDNGKLAFGTISNGVIIVNTAGKIEYILNKENGLQNNTVLGLWADRQSNLWIALDKGIDYAAINFPFVYYLDKTGILGSVYCAAIHNNRLYIGTNHGLFVSDWDTTKIHDIASFKAIPELSGQVWSLTSIDNNLICGHNRGTFSIKNDKAITLTNTSGVSALIKHPFKSNYYYQGTYIGIAIYEKDATGNISFKGMLTNTLDPIRYLQFDNEGNLWASHFHKGLFKYQLDETLTQNILTTNYSKIHGLNSDYQINTFKLKNRVVFANKGSFFTFDNINQKIIPYEHLNKQLKEYQSAHHVQAINTNEYWFFKKDRIALFSYRGDSLQKKDELFYYNIHGTSVDRYENIWKLTNNQYIVGLDDGFSIYTPFSSTQEYRQDSLQIRVKSLSAFSQKGDQLSIAIDASEKTHIPFNYNNINITFSSPGIIAESLSYSYQLNPKQPWIDIENQTSLLLNRLKWGDYNMKIMAREPNGENVTTTVTFTIAHPWYASTYAIIAYVLIVLLLLIFAHKLNKYRLNKQKLKYLKKIKLENEERIIKMRNKYLKTEISYQSRELANYTMLLSRRNEVLQQLKNDLTANETISLKEATLLRSKLIKTIDRNLSNKDEWQLFNAHFDRANNEFIKKLKEQHPDLTPNDLRFCAFLRMNITSKEIASLSNISVRSIEVKRYRLRKKLNLDQSQNLVKYMMEI